MRVPVDGMSGETTLIIHRYLNYAATVYGELIHRNQVFDALPSIESQVTLNGNVELDNDIDIDQIILLATKQSRLIKITIRCIPVSKS